MTYVSIMSSPHDVVICRFVIQGPVSSLNILDRYFVPHTTWYLVSDRKLGIFSKIKERENYNHMNTLSISRIII